MQIQPNEIAEITEGGMLDGHPVKFIKTKGGLNIAVGRPKGKYKDEALGAGSHVAIVRFNIEKQYPNFQPAMMKSENFSDSAIVEKHSHFLSDDLRKSGHDIYSIQEGDLVNFHVTKHNAKIASASGLIDNNFLIINKLDIPKEFAHGMAGASVEKATGSKMGLRFKK